MWQAGFEKLGFILTYFVNKKHSIVYKYIFRINSEKKVDWTKSKSHWRAKGGVDLLPSVYASPRYPFFCDEGILGPTQSHYDWIDIFKQSYFGNQSTSWNTNVLSRTRHLIPQQEWRHKLKAQESLLDHLSSAICLSVNFSHFLLLLHLLLLQNHWTYFNQILGWRRLKFLQTSTISKRR